MQEVGAIYGNHTKIYLIVLTSVRSGKNNKLVFEFEPGDVYKFKS